MQPVDGEVTPTQLLNVNLCGSGLPPSIPHPGGYLKAGEISLVHQSFCELLM